MFGLSSLFGAIGRLTASISRTADLFDDANARLAERLTIPEQPETLGLPAPEAVENGDGRKRARVRA